MAPPLSTISAAPRRRPARRTSTVNDTGQHAWAYRRCPFSPSDELSGTGAFCGCGLLGKVMRPTVNFPNRGCLGCSRGNSQRQPYAAPARIVVGVTDNRWAALLRDRGDITEANFWQPSPHGFKALSPGSRFSSRPRTRRSSGMTTSPDIHWSAVASLTSTSS